jgi:hypothetical protein
MSVSATPNTSFVFLILFYLYTVWQHSRSFHVINRVVFRSNYQVKFIHRSRNSSVSIVSDYGLDDRTIEARPLAEAKDFSCSRLIPDRLWGPPSLLSSGYRGFFLGGKAQSELDADHSTPLVPRSWMSRSYNTSPPSSSTACSETVLLYFSFLL